MKIICAYAVLFACACKNYFEFIKKIKPQEWNKSYFVVLIKKHCNSVRLSGYFVQVVPDVHRLVSATVWKPYCKNWQEMKLPDSVQ